jgi:hypothetical protein
MSRQSLFSYALAGIAIVALLANLGTGKQEVSAQQGYPSETITNFINTCRSAPRANAENICACSFRKIQSNFTYAEFVAISKESGYSPGRIKMKQLVKECEANPNS